MGPKIARLALCAALLAGGAAGSGCMIFSRSARLDAYIEAHPQASAEHRAKMARGEIWIGASHLHVQVAWGYPSRVNRTVTGESEHEQWVYRSGFGGDRYVYLENGWVTDWQD